MALAVGVGGGNNLCEQVIPIPLNQQINVRWCYAFLQSRTSLCELKSSDSLAGGCESALLPLQLAWVIIFVLHDFLFGSLCPEKQ